MSSKNNDESSLPTYEESVEHLHSQPQSQLNDNNTQIQQPLNMTPLNPESTAAQHHTSQNVIIVPSNTYVRHYPAVTYSYWSAYSARYWRIRMMILSASFVLIGIALAAWLMID